jgi:hypothetical protein
MPHTPSTPINVDSAQAYRDHLLPLIRGWHERGARVGVFGTGPHTTDLLAAVPELEELPLAAYLESAADGSARYRNRPVLPLSAIESAIDVVICSSYTREVEQLRLLRRYAVEAYPSRLPQPGSSAAAAAYLLVPTFGYPVVLEEESYAPFAALESSFARQMDGFRAALQPLRPYFHELDDVPAEPIDDVTPFWNNGYFGEDDARVAYGLVRAHRPARIFEIGGGNSTKFMHRAIVRNGGGTRITSIDPCPRGAIDSFCAEIIRQPLQRVDPAVFDVLEPGDVLFMDGTHQVFRGTDSVTFYLHVLPRIKPGVHVHIHDITLPLDYHDEFGDRYYAEQYLVAALLLGGDAWRVTLPVAYLGQQGVLTRGGGSFWIQRA